MLVLGGLIVPGRSSPVIDQHDQNAPPRPSWLSYPIARVRTGQFTPGDGHVWEAEFAAGAVEDEQKR